MFIKRTVDAATYQMNICIICHIILLEINYNMLRSMINCQHVHVTNNMVVLALSDRHREIHMLVWK